MKSRSDYRPARLWQRWSNVSLRQVMTSPRSSNLSAESFLSLGRLWTFNPPCWGQFVPACCATGGANLVYFIKVNNCVVNDSILSLLLRCHYEFRLPTNLQNKDRFSGTRQLQWTWMGQWEITYLHGPNALFAREEELQYNFVNAVLRLSL